jgi:outer membrane protein assembly factor BamB
MLMKHCICVAVVLLVQIRDAGAAPILSVPHVLVSSASFGDGVSRVNAATGQYIDKLFTGLNLSSGAPMAVGPDGNLYIGSFSQNVVHKFNIRIGSYYGIFAAGANGVRGITFGPNGNLFVAAASANAVKEYDGITGEFIRNFISISTPIDLMFGPGNILYVARGHHQISNPSSIVRYDGLSGAFLGTFASQQVDTPQSLLVGSDGDVFVTNQWFGAAPLVKFDGATGAVEFTATGLGNPQGLLLLPDRTLLVATHSSLINRYNADTGAFLGAFISDSRLGTTSDLIYVVPEPSSAMLGVTAILILICASRGKKCGAKNRSWHSAVFRLSHPARY